MIKLRVSRPLHFSGKRYEPGEAIRVGASAAAELLDSGRVALTDARDREAIERAKRQAIEGMRSLLQSAHGSR